MSASTPWSDLERSTAATTTPAAADPEKSDAESGEEKKKRPSQTELLIELAADFELWHSLDGEPFATVPVNGHRAHLPIRSRSFKLALRHRFFDRHGKAPSSQPVADAVNALDARAVFQGDCHPVAVRIAEHDGAVYVDLGGDDWTAVQVTPSGWRVRSPKELLQGDAEYTGDLLKCRDPGRVFAALPVADGVLAGFRQETEFYLVEVAASPPRAQQLTERRHDNIMTTR